MSFWESAIGEITGSENEAFVKTFKQIPDGTMALGKIDTFINVDYQGFKYLLIEWLLVDGDFKGQKVQHKIKVFGGDKYDKDPEKTRFRSLNMLKLIYRLFNVSPKNGAPPSDQDLAIFVGKKAGIKIRETEPNDEGRQYNWISEVHKSEGFRCETGISVVVTHKNNQFFDQEPVDSALSRNSYYKNDQGHTESDIPF